jgi:HAD superfamily hydrolase (TIGR01509 family)
VREAARLLKISVDEVATIGDQLNDVAMLKVAGMGIAMGNSTPDVQRFARHVTRSNDDEGFAHAVDAFILGEPPMAESKLGLPPRTRACLFGLEGVLTQSSEHRAHAWKRLIDYYLKQRAQTSGVPFIPFDTIHDYSRYFDGRSPLEGIRAFLAARNIELREKTVFGLVEKQTEVLAEELQRAQVEAYEGSVNFVKQARAAGMRTAVISAGSRAREALRSAGIDALFDAVIETQSHTGAGTAPAAEDYLMAVEAMGVAAEDTAVFEDTPGGLESARAAHLGYIVAVDRPPGHEGGLRHSGADVVIDDLSSLSEAHREAQ